MYLDVVSANIPMLPPDPLWHCYPLRLERFDVLFLEVVDRYRFDARADHLPEMASRLNMAERDWFGVEETDFEDLEDLIR